jgi:small subunit ribosomal protein S16
MVRIRLRRIGLKAQPSYRIVVADKESPRDGRFLEILGAYNPRTTPATITIQEDRVFDWMSRGAQPSESVAQLFHTVGLDDRFERFKKGEALDVLLAEAAAAETARTTSPKTSQENVLKKVK